jgi:hypothetical protein
VPGPPTNGPEGVRCSRTLNEESHENGETDRIRDNDPDWSHPQTSQRAMPAAKMENILKGKLPDGPVSQHFSCGK